MENTTPHKWHYASVILPLKFGGEISYIIPQIFEVKVGSRVKVDCAGKIYSGVVSKILSGEEVPAYTPDKKEIIYKPLLEVENLPLVLESEIALWGKIADYYLCSIGEVFKAAYPVLSIRQESVKPRKSVEKFLEELEKKDTIYNTTLQPELSSAQQEAYNTIKTCFDTEPQKPVLLRGVTGSGKTEIYINLALEQLRKGNSVLYMVPEIAISKQLQNRLKKVFGERLLTFHSKQGAAEKARIHKILQHGEEPTATVVLGTRSALFLPFRRLGLIIVDEEHDASYKQTEPAPRYHAKDSAIFLSHIHCSNILLGSATPSFESEYNCLAKRFSQVNLTEKYFGATTPQVEIIDTIWARKSRQMNGNFSQRLINEIKRTVTEGGQVLVFRNRRSYSPIVECQECGAIPKCPHCNVYLSYHKYNNTLRCHYCDFITSFSGVCKECGTTSFYYKGAGTERLEEELASILPTARIARYDADIAKSKKSEEQVIKDFAEGNIDILIGTQMISKGFDFERLKLVAVIQADTILGVQDFRGDEKALQLFSQLMGRTGRRSERGKLIVQTNQKDHPVFLQLKSDNPDKISTLQSSGAEGISPLMATLLRERQEFMFAPYVRMVKITVKHRELYKADALCNEIKDKLSGCKELEYKELTGPFTPIIDKVRGEFIKCFYIKFARNSRLRQNKEALQQCIKEIKGGHAIILDVDPI